MSDDIVLQTETSCIKTSRSLCISKSPKLATLLSGVKGIVLPVKGAEDSALQAVISAFSSQETHCPSLSLSNVVDIHDVAVKLEVLEIQRQCHELLSSTRHFPSGSFFTLYSSCLSTNSGSSLMEHLYTYSSDASIFRALSASDEFLSCSPRVAESFLVNSWRAMVIRAVQPEHMSSDVNGGAGQLAELVDRATLLVRTAVECWSRHQPAQPSLDEGAVMAVTVREEAKLRVLKVISARHRQPTLPPPLAAPATLFPSGHNGALAPPSRAIDPNIPDQNQNRTRADRKGSLINPVVQVLQGGITKPKKITKNASAEGICSISGCEIPLGLSSKSYNLKYRLCDQHLKAQSVEIHGELHRFCQQCSKFHLCSEFDGKNRSCRQSLDKRKQKRRQR